MDEKINELVKSNDHVNLSKIEDEAYKLHRCIALVHLDNFKEAIKYAEKDSFEYLYCMYKQKQYKKVISKIRKIFTYNDLDDPQNLPITILEAQCLYFLGYYKDSFKILSRLNDPTVLVNLNGMRSLILSLKESKKIQKYLPKSKNEINDEELKLINDFFKDCKVDEEIKDEYDFNGSFMYLRDEQEFVDYLESNIKNKLMEEQFNNLVGNFDSIEYDKLSKRKKEIFEHNKTGNEIKNNIYLFPKENSSYRHLLEIKNKLKTKNITKNSEQLVSGYEKSIPNDVKLYTAIKSRKYVKAKKMLEKKEYEDVKYREMFDLLISPKPSQKEIISVLRKIKENK